jgi:hypothetical protein
MIMDKAKKEHPGSSSTQGLIDAFLLLNILQFCTIMLVVGLQRRRDKTRHRRNSSVTRSGLPASNDPTQPLLDVSGSHRRYSTSGSRMVDAEISKKEVRRGKIFATMSAALIVFAWVFFLTTAWFKLVKKRGDKGLY